MRPLKDNAPVQGDIASENVRICREIQEQINRSRCFLTDLLELPEDAADRRPAPPPAVFRFREDGTFAAGNYVGQFEFHREDGGVERAVVGARGPGFPDAADEPLRDAQGRFFLRAMLEDCWEIPLYFLESDAEPGPGDFCGELLAARLAAQLDRAWRKGRLRFYRSFRRRDSRAQGRPDLPREIRLGMGLQDGRLACEVREFTEDNDYNRLFLLACLEAERRYPQLTRRLCRMLPGFHSALRTLRQAPWSPSDAGALLERTRRKIVNPIYRDYETLRIIARTFLRRQGSGVRSGGGAPFVTGIFLDLSALWERYLLKKILPPSAAERYQRSDHILDGKLLIRPDFLWPDQRVVLDAKYKFRWGEALGGRWSGSLHEDVYQVLSYMLGLNCSRGGVVFPTDQAGLLQRCAAASLEELSPEKLRFQVGRRAPSDGFSFFCLPFAVPSEGSDYGAFRQAMDREAARLSGQIARLLFHSP